MDKDQTNEIAPEEQTSGGGGFNLFDTIINNPDLISKFSGLLSGLNLSGSGEVNETANKEAGEDTHSASPTGTNDLTGGLASLLENKELMSKLPGILAALKPSGQSASPTSAGIGHSHPKKGVDNSIALICALKPYMSGRRREMIDYITKVNKLSDVFTTLT